MRANSILVFGVAFGALILTAPAHGEEDLDDDELDLDADALSAEQLRILHSKFDRDQDGKVSMPEIMAYSQEVGKEIAAKDILAILEEIDSSKDGKLSLEEHLADVHNQADTTDEEEMKELEIRKKHEAAKFASADMNGDEVLDKSEIPALFYPETHDGVLAVTVKQTMEMKDTNQDGKLSPAEFWEVEDDLANMPTDDELSEEELADFAKLDLDGDGGLSIDELHLWESGRFHTQEAMKKLFEVADKDSDMHVTAEELAAAREHIAASDAQYHLVEWAEHLEL